MTQVFLKLVNMSISASWLVLAVLALRFVLKKAPKWVNVLLWGVVAMRLLCPFSIESALSLVPSAETIPEKVLSGPSFTIQTGITPVDDRVNDYLGGRYYEGVTVPAGNGVNVMSVLAVIWGAGVILMLAYTAVSYLRLRRKVDTAVLLRENVFQSENVPSPFVLGVVKPKIYLPFKMAEQDVDHVVAHEKAHIRRRDHWWKPLGFLLLTVHWFNPLMWLAYVTLCRDIELACDEKVIQGLGSEQRADYTQALLACSVSSRVIAACPLAFGEVGVKERVKSVLNYKKPAFWIVAASVAACAVVAVCFLTDPVERPDQAVEEAWPALEDLRENYSAKQAASDGCVVLDGNELLAGEKQWIDFVNKTEAGESAAVRIYQAYSSQGEDYYVKELRYDGEAFRLRFYNRTGDTHEEFLDEREYRYLVRSPRSERGITTDHYFLADSSEVTAAGYFGSLFSSVPRPEYAIYNSCYPIYGNRVDQDYDLNSFWDTAFMDIDNDAQEEKCCLGRGMTSGVFTFTISVYGKDGIEYQSVFYSQSHLGSLSFATDREGRLLVQGVTQGDEPETVRFELQIVGGDIELLDSEDWILRLEVIDEE